MGGTLDVEDLPGGVRRLTVQHLARKNALDDGILRQLHDALRTPPSVRVLWVRGAGGAFSAGYDLHQLSRAPAPNEPLPDALLGEVLDALTRHPAPSIAQVQGPAFGAGCELACACDFRVGDATAVFSLPPAKLGLVYAPAGIRRVQTRVGAQRARLMFLTAQRVDAQRALDYGLLDVLGADAEAQTQALASELAALSPRALAGMKVVLDSLLPPAREDPALEALRRERFASADAAEGRASFLERRAARFLDRER
ncbi:MAG: enoyl-CoA hydratase/isomerase family protein [Myxococcaceae bacterium]|nr:enoyl-CoA hydratase/isomerase family protein [Myxococcaceae bacterium]